MKINIACFLFGIIVGVLLSSLVFHSLKENEKPLVQLPSPKELQKEVVKTETNYAKKYDSLKLQSVKLNNELSSTKTTLQKEKTKNHSLHVQVFELLDKHFDEQSELAYPINSPCDSLALIVPDLIASSVKKDSLYEQATANLEEQLENKDSVVLANEQQYIGLKTVFAKSIVGQTMLEDQNKTLAKEVKRQKRKSKFLSAVIFVFGGAAVNYLLRH